MKTDQNNNFMFKTGDILNFSIFPGNNDLAGVVPEKLRYLGI
jgi:hypothetical protein